MKLLFRLFVGSIIVVYSQTLIASEGTTLSVTMSLSNNCSSLVKEVNELNQTLSFYDVDKKIKILRCFKKNGIFKNSFQVELTWTGGLNRCDGTTVGSDFYKFLQLKDDSQLKKTILEKLGFIPIQLKNYSYNYMISLCQLYLSE